MFIQNSRSKKRSLHGSRSRLTRKQKLPDDPPVLAHLSCCFAHFPTVECSSGVVLFRFLGEKGEDGKVVGKAVARAGACSIASEVFSSCLTDPSDSTGDPVPRVGELPEATPVLRRARVR